MKRLAICSVLLFILVVSGQARAVDVSVEIAGGDDLVRLKDGIQRTISARCLAGNVLAGADAALRVSLIELGETISFDAVLETIPPRAFHRDLGSRGELSTAIDQMIGEIATAPSRPSAATDTDRAAQPPSPGNSLVEVPAPPAPSGNELPFVATSMTVLGGSLYVSDKKTLYRVQGGEATPCWQVPGSALIYRIHPHGDSLLVVTNRRGSFHTYQVREAQTVRSWERCVVPLGDTLAMSRLMRDQSLSPSVILWKEPTVGDGGAYRFPKDLDFASAWSVDLVPSHNGPEMIAFDKNGRLTVNNGIERLMTSGTTVPSLPLYIEDTRTFGEKEEEPNGRYYLMPRVLVHNGDVVTIVNEQGGWGFLGKVKFYKSARVVSFSPERSSLEERDLAVIRKHYCADIALDRGELVMLIVKDSTSLIERIDL